MLSSGTLLITQHDGYKGGVWYVVYERLVALSHGLLLDVKAVALAFSIVPATRVNVGSVRLFL